MFLWLTHWARNLLWDSRGDCFWWCDAFPFNDFGLSRIGSSSAVYPGSLDSLRSSSDISSSSAWALGTIWNGLGFAKSFSLILLIEEKVLNYKYINKVQSAKVTIHKYQVLRPQIYKLSHINNSKQITISNVSHK